MSGRISGVVLAAAVALLPEASAPMPSVSYRLTMEDRLRHIVVWSGPVAAGDVVTLHYDHSLYGAPQAEVFRVETSPPALRLLRVIFVSRAAAEYYDGYAGEQPPGLVEDRGGWERRSIGLPLSALTFRSGIQTRHRLDTPRGMVLVSDLAPPGTSLRLSVSEDPARSSDVSR